MQVLDLPMFQLIEHRASDNRHTGTQRCGSLQVIKYHMLLGLPLTIPVFLLLLHLALQAAMPVALSPSDHGHNVHNEEAK